MQEASFNKYADEYNRILTDNLEFFGKDIDYYAQYKTEIVREYLQKKPLKILDYGCGIGNNVKFLSEVFPDSEICGCDISAKSLEIAARSHPRVKFFLLDKNSPLENGFDLVFTANVFHHIPKQQRQDAVRQILEFLMPGGSAFIFEHNPYNPVTRHLVRTCAFDADAVLLKPGELKGLLKDGGLRVEMIRYTLFFPSFLKNLRFLETKLLRCFPLGGQYFVYAIKP
jgi:SAM-dependent methyltransferase